MRRLACLAIIASLGACGGPDPVPDAEDAASPAEINAAVGGAQEDAIDAGLRQKGLPGTPEGEAALAEEMISSEVNESADAPLTPPIGPAAGPGVKAAPVDPAYEEPLPRVQPRSDAR